MPPRSCQYDDNHETNNIEQPIRHPRTGMTNEEYFAMRAQQDAQMALDNLNRAIDARSDLELKFLNFKTLTHKDLANIARTERHAETRMGIDMKLWCDEVFHRIRTEQYENIQNELDGFDVGVMILEMSNHKFDEYLALGKTDAFAKFFIQEFKDLVDYYGRE